MRESGLPHVGLTLPATVGLTALLAGCPLFDESKNDTDGTDGADGSVQDSGMAGAGGATTVCSEQGADRDAGPGEDIDEDGPGLSPGSAVGTLAATWTQQFGTGTADRANAVALNADGTTAYVAGQQFVGMGQGYIRAFDTRTGETLWSNEDGDACCEAKATSVAVGPDGDVYVGYVWDMSP